MSTLFFSFYCTIPIGLASPPASEVAATGWTLARKALDQQNFQAVNPRMTEIECWGAVAILRRDGRVAGVGEAHGESPLPSALRQAVNDAAQRDPRLVSGTPSAAWNRLTLEIELDGAPDPVVGGSFAIAGSEIAPALDGVAVRRGDRWALGHPSILQALDAAGAPEQTFLSLTLQLGLPARELKDIDPSERVGLYKFSAVRVVQPDADSGPVLVVRGSRLEPALAPRDAATLARSTASDIAEWFDRAMIRTPAHHGAADSATPAGEADALSGLGLRGDYLPSQGSDKSLCADAAGQALAAYALAHWAASCPNAENAGVSRANAIAILESLGKVAPVESDPLADPKAVAWSVLASTQLGNIDELPDGAKKFLANARGLLPAINAPDAAHPYGGELLERALSLAAHSALERAGTPTANRDALLASIDELWNTKSRGRLVGALDWLIVCDNCMGTRSEEHAAIARTARIALARAQLGTSAPTESDTGPRSAADLSGAFALTGSGNSGANLQSARPGHALALMLSDTLWTPVGEQFRARAMQSALVRFLKQLAYDDVSSYLAPDRRRVLGALKAAPWDSEVSVAGNAMALLCLTDSTLALDRINETLESVQP